MLHLPDIVPGSISQMRVENVTFTRHCSWQYISSEGVVDTFTRQCSW